MLLIKKSLENSTCPSEYFRCESGECINKSRFCDLVSDCHDGDDERNCGKSIFLKKLNNFDCYFLCNNGT